MKIQKAIVVGSSAGGPIALELALSNPERVIALCLPNTGANLASLERPQGRTRLDLVQRSKSDGDRAVFEERKASLRVPVPSDSNDPVEIVRQEKLKAALQTISDDDLYRYAIGEIRNFEAYLGVDYAPRLGELKMPVCIIHGTADRVVPYAWGKRCTGRSRSRRCTRSRTLITTSSPMTAAPSRCATGLRACC